MGRRAGGDCQALGVGPRCQERLPPCHRQWAGSRAGRGWPVRVGLPARTLTASSVTGGEARWPGPATTAAMVSQGQAPLSPTYVGLWDFEARTDEELSFRAGDLFHVARKEEEWWWATRLDAAGRTLGQGYVPHNYLAEKETVQSES